MPRTIRAQVIKAIAALLMPFLATHFQMTSAADTCRSWCEEKDAQWSHRCTWPQCSTCPKCNASLGQSITGIKLPRSCKEWCSSQRYVSYKWSLKCTWPNCMACSECSNPQRNKAENIPTKMEKSTFSDSSITATTTASTTPSTRTHVTTAIAASTTPTATNSSAATTVSSTTTVVTTTSSTTTVATTTTTATMATTTNGSPSSSTTMAISSASSTAVTTIDKPAATASTASTVTCGPGSPPSCQATTVTNAKGYSAGQVVRITNGLRVYKADQKNSCPTGYKIWSPRNKHDWIIMYSSLGQNIDNYPRNPNLIVDVTRPLDKCDGIEKISMKSTTAHQNWWKTSDGSSWWLRDSAFEQTCEDYRSNCYLDVYDVNPDNVQFNFGNCSFSSTDYLCQQKCIPIYPGLCSDINFDIESKQSVPVEALLLVVFIAIFTFMGTAIYVVFQHCRWPKRSSGVQTERHDDPSNDSPSPNPNYVSDPTLNPHDSEIELPVTSMAVALDMSQLEDDVIIPVAEISPRLR